MSRETLPLLYRDEYLVAVHKPSGLLVHRSMIDRHETRFAMQIVRNQLGQRVYPVHRLDKGTSGILMFALDQDTARTLTAAFETRAVEKTYLAVVRGWLPEAGCIDHPLARLIDAYEFAGDAVATSAQDAVTDYRRLASTELDIAVDRYPTSRYSLAELSPLTGRRHQLRRHLKHASHPIIGDATYGKGRHNRMFAERFGVARMLLACVDLKLAHPVSGEALELGCPLADDMQSVIAALGWADALHPH
ncbi:tRNA pseudouridine synthase TruC [Jeongeupia sp. HS-3]|uniref:tRNA pseudouridine(65) synthase TruC n=1 Tax=Jeongeupia sp. HS-3 TaxID=1009682 RepID=UPI0018A61529|nr:tRNA pseudouridine(65) synthase TruC [Jeongeupia sp. HS-3]BCL74782.1 tRNA pseudouridine synthase TruC [Jeongeupia sp. HS-3]